MSRVISSKKSLKPVEYPTSDGRPMAETDLHLWDMIEVLDSLWVRYAEEPNVCVSGNLLIFYEPGNKRKHLAPDAFVVFGVPKRLRDNYLVWEEGKSPDVVFEITSKTTRREDTGKKRLLYRDVLKVKELFLFDPTEDYLHPRLQGFQLSDDGEYRSIEMQDGRLWSEVLGAWVEVQGTSLRFRDGKTGKLWPTAAEKSDERAEQERQQANQERQRADRLAKEIEQLREQMKRRDQQ